MSREPALGTQTTGKKFPTTNTVGGKAPSNNNNKSAWQEYAQRGMLDPSSQGPMLTDSPKTAKILPINPPQSWTSTAALESNGVSVTLISAVGTAVPTTGTGNGSMSTITSAVATTSNGTNIESNIPKKEHIVPIIKDGMAMCEHCSAVGVKHAFYTKKRNFCSAQCVKAASKKTEAVEQAKLMSVINNSKQEPRTTVIPQLPHSEPMEYESEDSSRSSSVNEGANTIRSSSSASTPYSESDVVPSKRNKLDLQQTFDWTPQLNNSNFVAAAVSGFKHAPVSHLWDNVTVGMKVEVENTDVAQINYQTAFWVASVIKIQAYKVLLRFEGFCNDSSCDFWVNLCSEDVHHVGWCATKGKPLIPPRSISGKYPDWRDFLVKRLTGARTLPQNFQAKVMSGLKSKYELGTELEVTDKNRICQLRLATVQRIVGKRLHVKYFDTDEDGGFWCHEDSPLLHPKGWATTVGHLVAAPKSYRPDLLPRTAFNLEYEHLDLKEGMKVEAIDPLNLSAICAATIKKVLKYGYIMVRVDCYEEDSNGSDWFCYHITSAYIFPCGFCARNGVVLTPPHGYQKDSFRWEDFLERTKTKAAPLHSLNKEALDHDFKVGMRIEAADLMDPRLICVATISQVVGRLLKIHFDGWEEEYDQWLDATSPDIYPVGWAELVNHKLEAPRAPAPPLPVKKGKKGRKKSGIKATKAAAARAGTRNSNRVTVQKMPEKAIGIKTTPVHQPAPQTHPPSQLSRSNEPPIQPMKLTIIRKPNETEGSKPSTLKGIEDKVELTQVCQRKTEERLVIAAKITPSTSTIPRLIDCPSISEMDEVDPAIWTMQDVAEFLKTNDCGAYCDSFSRNKLDGQKLMTLTKDQIVVLTGMKVGPALKIQDLIGQLKRLVTASRARKSAMSK